MSIGDRGWKEELERAENAAGKWELAYQAQEKQIIELHQRIEELKFHDKVMKRMADKKNMQIIELEKECRRLNELRKDLLVRSV